MAEPLKQPNPDPASRVLALLKRHWLPLVLVVLAVVFVLQNTDRTGINFGWMEFRAPLWIILVVVTAIGFLIGWTTRRRSKRNN